MHLYHCTASVEPAALQHLQEHLETLHLTFTQAAEIPVWVYSLRGLQELHLTGRLSNEGGMGRGWALGSLRQLHHLRVLVLRGMLQKVPGELSELAGSLLKLEIYNEGTRLLVTYRTEAFDWTGRSATARMPVGEAAISAAGAYRSTQFGPATQQSAYSRRAVRIATSAASVLPTTRT